jgi:hypothetical protein
LYVFAYANFDTARRPVGRLARFIAYVIEPADIRIIEDEP